MNAGRMPHQSPHAPSVRAPFIWTASQLAVDGRTLTCEWCGHLTDWLGSQMGNYAMGWACRDCMTYGAPPASANLDRSWVEFATKNEADKISRG